MKRCILLLALCLALDIKAQGSENEQGNLAGERRLQFKAGLGTQQALHTGLAWHIPLSQNGRHIFAPEFSIGVRLFDPVLVAGAGITWFMIERTEKRGGMIGLTVTAEKWGDEADKRSRKIITLHPGVIIRTGSGILTLTAGAGPSFTHRERVEWNSRSVTDESDLFYNVDASLSFDLFDLFD